MQTRRLLLASFSSLICATLLHAPTASAVPETVPFTVVKIGGMDCTGCEKKVISVLGDLSGVTTVNSSFAEAGACLGSDQVLAEAAVVEALAIHNYTLEQMTTVKECPAALLPGAKHDPWAGSESLDVQTISNGEKVDLKGAIVPGKFTFIDFGAHWCGPCHESADLLKGYLAQNADTAVRVVNLGGADPERSYGQPVVAQHLASAPGIPWFVIYEPGGKRIYKGGEINKAIAAIDKARAKLASK